MSLVTRGMGVSGSGTGDGYPIASIVESIEGQITSETDIQGTVEIQPKIIGTVSNEDDVSGTKESDDKIKTTITEEETIKGKVNE